MLVLTVLNDNTGRPGLLNGWGWSILVDNQADEWRLVFDSGPKPEILEYNSKKLNTPLDNLDLFVISHEHWDHTGGAPAIARHNPNLETIVPPGDHGWASGLDLRLVENHEGGRLGLKGVFASAPLYAGSVGLYEEALGVETEAGLLVVVGCSHPGVSRLVENVLEIAGYDRALLVIGGYHGPSGRELDRLLELSEFVSPVHCSGLETVEYVRQVKPSSLVLVRTGSRVMIGGSGLEVVY